MLAAPFGEKLTMSKNEHSNAGRIEPVGKFAKPEEENIGKAYFSIETKTPQGNGLL